MRYILYININDAILRLHHDNRTFIISGLTTCLFIEMFLIHSIYTTINYNSSINK